MKAAALCLLLAGSAPLLAQQTCNTASYALSSPSSRFEDNGDGTVTDRASKLMWLRCSLGQRWSGGNCVGEVGSHSLRSAQAAAEELNRRGELFYNDWRVPQIHELASIAERQCDNPRINLGLFPNTPAAYYWTASSRPARRDDTSAFALSFGAGGLRYEDKGDAHHVRLVRSAL